MTVHYNQNHQAIPGPTQPIPSTAFDPSDSTEIYWLGNAGTLIHSHSTNLLIDPLLQGFDMKSLIEFPITTEQIHDIDGVLLTHIDSDHFSRPTCSALKPVVHRYHAVNYVADVLKEEGYPAEKHDIHDTFTVGDVSVQATPAKHDWQNYVKKWQYRTWKESDYCGYYLTCKEGTVWMVGDSKLLESQLHMKEPDVILFDFSDNEWHITLSGAIRLANTYPHARLICIHWGSVDAPDMTPFNGDPNRLQNSVIHPERILTLAPGEKFTL